ncbi:MAG: nicotinamide-nucleotide adenylyltransferase [Nanoarchaeota archaeon]|nr:nicotinamide-nucleotide adenylyltransferase [Nanoarchaeota archaeon]
MSTGLFVGRFQPFHRGHLADVKLVLSQCDEVIIVVGSAQESRTAENPFTAEERCELIDASLASEHISAYQIVVLEDINEDERWVDYVTEHVGSFDKVYTGNSHVGSLFSAKGVSVVTVPLIDEIAATKIRSLITGGESWEEMVPDAVARKIKTLDLKKHVH